MPIERKHAMALACKAQVEKIGTPISAELYQELRGYALSHKIRISGFRNYVGGIETIILVKLIICRRQMI